MVFDAFRKYGGPTYYEEVHTPWEGDLLTGGLIFCFVIIAVSFYLILPGVAGKDKLFMFIRITTSLFIGGVILVTNFAQTWETAETSTIAKYKAGIGQEVNVTIGVQIGFRGVNITLKGEKDAIIGETINYNEHFSWEGLQGRFGFGPFAGTFNQQYRAAQLRGLPLPILWIAEYFTLDGEGIRWGRFYRQAGWYSHIILWLAFPLWLLTNILFLVLLRFGAYFLALTGLAMITSNIIWATYRNYVELKIPFTEHDVLEFTFGGSFWVCLITGIICVLLGIVIFLIDKLCPTLIAAFFGVDVLQDSESIIVEEDTAIPERRKKFDRADNSGEGAANGDMNNVETDDDDEELYLPPLPLQQAPPTPDRAAPFMVRPKVPNKVSFRTAEHRFTKRLQQPRRRDPPPLPNRHVAAVNDGDDDGDYQNAMPQKPEPRKPLGNRQSLAEDDLYENSQPIEMTSYGHH